MKKAISLFFTLVVSLLLFNSCEEVSSKADYTFGITDFVGSSSDRSKVENYLKGEEVDGHTGVKIYLGNMTFDSGTAQATEQEAIDFLNLQAEKINEKELAAILAGKDAKFSYTLSTASGDVVKSISFAFGSDAE